MASTDVTSYLTDLTATVPAGAGKGVAGVRGATAGERAVPLRAKQGFLRGSHSAAPWSTYRQQRVQALGDSLHHAAE